MSTTDLYFDYAVSIFVLISVIVTAVLFFKAGYHYGRDDGWREGLHRGSKFGRLKILETEQNNGKRKL